MSGRPLRVTLITTAIGPPIRGNGTTVHRWLGWLPDVQVQVAPLHPGFELPPGPPPDIVHGYHAVHGGAPARTLAARHGIPLVVSLGGTDLWALRRGRDLDGVVRDVLSASTVVTGAFPGFADALAALLDDAPPYLSVPRGVHVPDLAPPTPGPALRILLPAGLRPVKDPLHALALLDRLRQADVPAALTVAGPALDTAYAETFVARIAGRDDVRWIEVPRHEMPGLYERSDVVWNTSLHEGGANALLEGLAHGCAVYARDVPGNRDLLGAPDAPGTLFDERADDVVGFHARLLEETPETRTARVAATRTWLRAHHDSLAEARALRHAYDVACERAGGCP